MLAKKKLTLEWNGIIFEFKLKFLDFCFEMNKILWYRIENCDFFLLLFDCQEEKKSFVLEIKSIFLFIWFGCDLSKIGVFFALIFWILMDLIKKNGLFVSYFKVSWKEIRICHLGLQKAQKIQTKICIICNTPHSLSNNNLSTSFVMYFDFYFNRFHLQST